MRIYKFARILNEKGKMSTERKIAYVYSDEFIHYCNQLPKVKQRVRGTKIYNSHI
jgi:hypothetical protein